MVLQETVVNCPAACGYLVKRDKLTSFADGNGIPYAKNNHIMLRGRVTDFVKARHPKVPLPFTTMYPRGQSPYRSPRYLMFATGVHPKVPFTFQFTETERDLDVFKQLMSLDSDMRNLLTDAKFVTVPDPMNERCLPGERPGPDEEVCSPVPLQPTISR
jgi:hypothetical protein